MVKEEFKPASNEGDIDDATLQLAEKVLKHEGAFAQARETYAALSDERQQLLAQIDASGLPRKDVENSGRSRRIDEIDAHLAKFDKKFHDESVEHAVDVEDLDDRIRRGLN